MGNACEYKPCKCGNPQMISDYHYKSEVVYESCDVCGYYRIVRLANKIESGVYPENWTPDYHEDEGKTGYVVKIKDVDNGKFEVAFVEESDLGHLITVLESNESVHFFGITFMGTKGYYLTQIFRGPNTNN